MSLLRVSCRRYIDRAQHSSVFRYAVFEIEYLVDDHHHSSVQSLIAQAAYRWQLQTETDRLGQTVRRFQSYSYPVSCGQVERRPPNLERSAIVTIAPLSDADCRD